MCMDPDSGGIPINVRVPAATDRSFRGKIPSPLSSVMPCEREMTRLASSPGSSGADVTHVRRRFTSPVTVSRFHFQCGRLIYNIGATVALSQRATRTPSGTARTNAPLPFPDPLGSHPCPPPVLPSRRSVVVPTAVQKSPRTTSSLSMNAPTANPPPGRSAQPAARSCTPTDNGWPFHAASRPAPCGGHHRVSPVWNHRRLGNGRVPDLRVDRVGQIRAAVIVWPVPSVERVHGTVGI